MKPGKLSAIALILSVIISSNIQAEVIKPFAPPMDINGNEIEKNDNINGLKEGVIKKIYTSESPDVKESDETSQAKILEEKDEINLDKQYDNQIKIIENYNTPEPLTQTYNIDTSKQESSQNAVTENAEPAKTLEPETPQNNSDIEKQENTGNVVTETPEPDKALEPAAQTNNNDAKIPENIPDVVTNTAEPVEIPKDEAQENINNDAALPFETEINATKAFTDMQKQAEEIGNEMRVDEEFELQELRVLWTAAVEKSSTIRLAIQKLSSPDEGKDTQSTRSKIFSPLASVASIAAMAATNSTQAAGALLGGGMFGELASDRDNAFNQAFIKLSDYNLIMLAKAVDELQKQLVMNYYEYKQALDRLVEAEEAMNRAEELYNKAQKSNNFASITASDAFYRESKQNHLNAKQNFFNARSDLEQITGNNAIVYIETMKNQLESPEGQTAQDEKKEPSS